MAQRPPDGGTWFPRLAPALEAAQSGVVMCWEMNGTRVFGAYASHAAMWGAIQRAPPPHCAYEIIREHDRCKAFADLEFYCPLAEREAVAPAIDHALRVFLEHFRSIGGGGRLTVLDGTRVVELPPAKALEWFSSSADTAAVKFSYHVLVQVRVGRVRERRPYRALCFTLIRAQRDRRLLTPV